MIRRRRTSLVERLVRAGTAVVTVWCLGCSSFDLLFMHLAGSSNGVMICGGDEQVGASTTALDGSSSGVGSVREMPDDVNPSQGVLCDCQSCTAPSPTPLVAAIPGSDLPRLIAVHSATPSSRETEPLVPPPQIT